jgi:2-amino-4-hydroxy-6-hydroxymethyldihydropteridine diphosphokinase
MSGVSCYIGLGANLEDPVAQVRRALVALSGLPQTRLVAHSRLYRNPPMGPPDQPDYVNAVACIETKLAPLDLLDGLHAIERDHGRVRHGAKWGARTLDLDMLLYGDRVIRHERLTVPHPGLPERAFVLYPLAEIAPGLDIPGHGAIGSLLEHCPPGDLRPVEPDPS